jgi:hypothetical protein
LICSAYLWGTVITFQGWICLQKLHLWIIFIPLKGCFLPIEYKDTNDPPTILSISNTFFWTASVV